MNSTENFERIVRKLYSNKMWLQCLSTNGQKNEDSELKLEHTEIGKKNN